MAIRKPKEKKATRFSGADWADQLQTIFILGAGGIGSWTALNLSRIGHTLSIMDMDNVDETNILGGQMFLKEHLDWRKVDAVRDLCIKFGSSAYIMTNPNLYTEGSHPLPPIVISAVDNMLARKTLFEDWVETDFEEDAALFIDGRLTMEMFEVFAIDKKNAAQIEEYRTKHLFSDADAAELDCTTKQSTFCAMGISYIITATLSNWLTNNKLKMDFREIPFYQRHYTPIFDYKKQEVGPVVDEVVVAAPAVPETTK